jgi:hypothetical protein
LGERLDGCHMSCALSFVILSKQMYIILISNFLMFPYSSYNLLSAFTITDFWGLTNSLRNICLEFQTAPVPLNLIIIIENVLADLETKKNSYNLVMSYIFKIYINNRCGKSLSKFFFYPKNKFLDIFSQHIP